MLEQAAGVSPSQLTKTLCDPGISISAPLWARLSVSSSEAASAASTGDQSKLSYKHATVRWTRRRLRKTMTLTSEVPLVSHYRDQGAYLSKEQQLFQERFNALDTPWQLDVGQDSFHLGGRSVWLPDFVLKKGNTVLHLEVLGYWRPEAVRKRIRLLNKYGPKHWLIAVSRKRRASKASIEFEGPILEFAEILSPKKVIEVAESL